jgi:Zn-dependent protease with chaperone function
VAATAAYKRRAWLAVAGLLLFALLYLGLAATLAYTSWHLLWGVALQGEGHLGHWLAGAGAGLLAFFMLKGLWFIERHTDAGQIEIKPDQQPRLWAFLQALAQRAGAPRPHRVFVSARVNAAVFSDVSLLNLFRPAPKNLEIGLALVNGLSLGELHAVLAHEFGHFAQRSMAVGRWVYMAQQIAAQLVGRRDAFDRFISGLSRSDPRVAWFGWLLGGVVWSIRALIDTAFQGVVLMQRALSREMEMNADLVAVSLTGSDALVHALHRLQTADEAWGRAQGFALSQKNRKLLVPDVFALQSLVVEHLGQLLNEPDYGQVPAPARAGDAQYRLFKPELAQPPQMWLSHPLNHEREANAKRNYLPADIDQRSAWDLFDDAAALRMQVSAHWLGEPGDDCTLQSPEAALAGLHEQFDRVYFQGRYRGIYFGRSITRCAAEVSALLDPPQSVSVASLDALYPASLIDDMVHLRGLGSELAQLKALHSGALKPVGGVLRHRDQALHRRQVPQALAQVERELADLQQRLQAHDRRCRSLHRDVALQIAPDWAPVLQGLLAVLHYADHTEANLLDLHGVMRNTVAVVAATRKVSKAGAKRIVIQANALHDALGRFFDHAGQFEVDAALLSRMDGDTVAQCLGPLKLPSANGDNLGDWLEAADGWVNHAAGVCSALYNRALEQLLLTEDQLAQHLRQRTQPGPAPAAARVPPLQAPLLLGAERKRQHKLGLWARFQLADGSVATVARAAVACSIVGSVLWMGLRLNREPDHSSLVIYNGLGRPVRVAVAGQAPAVVPAFSHTNMEAPAVDEVGIETRSLQGELIEQFKAPAKGRSGTWVYNVAGASPMVEWTAVYGNYSPVPPRQLGAQRWFNSHASALFGEPPRSIRTKGGGGSRDALAGLADEHPQRQLAALAKDSDRQQMVLLHARWDGLDTRYAGHWLSMASQTDAGRQLLAQRLAQAPQDVMLRRLEQDAAPPAQRAAVCAQHRALAAAAPASGQADWLYLTLRCQPEGPATERAMVSGHARYPQHAWLGWGAGHALAAQQRWPQALVALEAAAQGHAMLAEAAALDIARITRLVQPGQAALPKSLVERSPALTSLVALETSEGIVDPAYIAYSALAKGRAPMAVSAASGRPEVRQRLLRLAGASEGVDAGQVSQALALPVTQGIDSETVWPSLALAARQKQSLVALQAVARQEWAGAAEPLLRFLDALRQGQAPANAERLLDHLSPALRGHAYSMGVVLLGPQAPSAWRQGAKRLLFASERPYFF